MDGESLFFEGQLVKNGQNLEVPLQKQGTAHRQSDHQLLSLSLLMTAKPVALQLIEVGLQRDLVPQVSHQKATRLRSPSLQCPEARPDDRRRSAEVILRSAMTHEPGRHQCGGRGQERGEVAEEWQRVVHHRRGNAGKQSGEVFTWAAGEVRIRSKAKVVVERKNNRAAKGFFFCLTSLNWAFFFVFFYDESPKQLGLHLSERKRNTNSDCLVRTKVVREYFLVDIFLVFQHLSD